MEEPVMDSHAVVRLADRKLDAFSRGPDFQALVQEAVKPDQDTLRSLLRNLDCSLQVHQAVRRRAEQLEARLRGLQAQAAAEMVAQVPALVAREILQAFPAFAQQNQLDRMLLEHQGQVRAQLELLAAEALRRIVSEERYHRVNQAYFLAFAHKGQQMAQQQLGKWREVEAEERQLNDTTRVELVRECDRQVQGLQLELSELRSAQERLASLRAELAALERHQSNLRWTTVVLGVVVAGMCAWRHMGRK